MHAPSSTAGVLECQDGHVELLVLEQHQWLGLVALMGHPAWAAEFTDPMERGRRGGRNQPAPARLGPRGGTVADLVRSGQAAKVPIAPYNDARGVLTSPHNLERGVFTQATFEGLAREAMMVAPFRFPGQPLKASTPAPAPGAHNAAVLSREGPHEWAASAWQPAAPWRACGVLDFTLHAAGPFCTHLLTVLGAECIKIETAARPDIFRKPHPVYGRMESATFDQVNAGKKSIRLNLKHPRGVELARQLVALSDIVAESFRPGVMKRLGLDYESLKAIKPDLVMLSVSAAGQSGPDSRHAGYAPLFGAGGGLGHLTGYSDGPPVEVRHVMDHSTGLAATAGVLAACYRRKRTGQGQHVDVAASDVAMSFIGDALLEAAFKGVVPSRKGQRDARSCTAQRVPLPGRRPVDCRCRADRRPVAGAAGCGRTVPHSGSRPIATPVSRPVGKGEKH